MIVSFTVILMFWALSLSPVWPNFEGRQDLIYKTQIIFFYSENNPDSLIRPVITVQLQCIGSCIKTLSNIHRVPPDRRPSGGWVRWPGAPLGVPGAPPGSPGTPGVAAAREARG